MDWFKGKSTGNHRFSHEIWGLSCKFSLKPIHWIKVQWWYIWSDLIVMNPALLCDMLRSKCQQRAEARIPGCHIWNEAGSQQKYTQKKCQKVGILIFFNAGKILRSWCTNVPLMFQWCTWWNLPLNNHPWTARVLSQFYPSISAESWFTCLSVVSCYIRILSSIISNLYQILMDQLLSGRPYVS